MGPCGSTRDFEPVEFLELLDLRSLHTMPQIGANIIGELQVQNCKALRDFSGFDFTGVISKFVLSSNTVLDSLSGLKRVVVLHELTVTKNTSLACTTVCDWVAIMDSTPTVNMLLNKNACNRCD